jgi:hypothetical protein
LYEKPPDSLHYIVFLVAVSSFSYAESDSEQPHPLPLHQQPSLDEVLVNAGMQPDWLTCTISNDCSLVIADCEQGRAMPLFHAVYITHKNQAQHAIDKVFIDPPPPPGLSLQEKEAYAARNGGTCVSVPVEASCDSGSCVIKPGHLVVPESMHRQLEKLRQEQPPVP